MRITKKQAVHYMLAYQNLLFPDKLQGKEGILDYMGKVGCVQYDPLDVAGYNSHLVLQSRIKQYRSEYLQELLYVERKLLDGWDKNMAIYSVQDWPYFERYRREAFERYGDTFKEMETVLNTIRKAIDTKGPLSSIDIEVDGTIDWAWAPTRIARAALESMYFWGEFIIHHKVGTRKFYDFTNKHIHHDLYLKPDPNVTMEAYFQWHVKRRIGALGLLWNRPSDAWLGIHWMKSKDRTVAIIELEKRREIIAIEVEDIDQPLYIRAEDISLFHQVINSEIEEVRASFIAPLDNLLWDRKLIKEIFGFEYTWEVYKPASERKFGYYVLPVLYGGQFVARLEPKFHKKTKTLEIVNWWWEPDILVSEELKKALLECMMEFVMYLGAAKVVLNSERNAVKDLNWLKELLEKQAQHD
ncbi:DNA glycosylase AlkZ-like family protein [Anaerosolibacter sp.]|uniref:DNA glycosylase AlkZ-like family protein n=1 Tax=Anaerosolibacter sp. TaxID=1872527 RepID=UPI0039F12EB0